MCVKESASSFNVNELQHPSGPRDATTCIRRGKLLDIPRRHNLHMLSLTNLAHLYPTHNDIVSSRPGPPGPVFEHPLRHVYTIPGFGILGNGRHEGYEACFFCPPVSASLNDR